jgi:spermidine synthase
VVPASRSRSTLYALFFFSGAAALTYQVIWARQLAIIFGSTAQAAAIVIALFFTGIAAGSWFWGNRAAARPLATFGWLELGVALAALAHLGLVGLYQTVYPALYSWSQGTDELDLIARMLIATLVLLPPSFLMGGTLPAMAEAISAADLTKFGSVLYAVNTLGGATGAFAAGFILPPLVGFSTTYLIAIFVDAVVGLVALNRSRREGGRRRPIPPNIPRRTDRPSRIIRVIAFSSGAATLGVEIVWTRLFAQVLQNSAYTYAIVLSTFLISLTVGAMIARLLASCLSDEAQRVLALLLVLSAAAAVTSPLLFHWATGDVLAIGKQTNFLEYVIEVLRVASIVILIPGAVLGAVLPFLLRFLQTQRRTAGQTLGHLVMVNTIGAAFGALVTGFVLLPNLGTWRTLLVIAITYCLLVVALSVHRTVPTAAGLLAGVAGIALILWTPPAAHTVRLLNVDERLIAFREGTQATVSVVGQGTHQAIRVNNTYTLGGTRSHDSERTQALLPLALHGEAGSVFTLGMGTGITAGATLHYPIHRLLVCELITDVVTLAQAYFEHWVNGLFTDQRAQILAEDGRVCLSRSTESFDVIVSDLFTPWHAGTGNLYTLDHFAAARERLNPDGFYVQWIPLYQVSDREFGSLARTMSEAFDQVTVWRGDFFPSRSIVALIGHTNEHPLDMESVSRPPSDPKLSREEHEAALLRMYVGNVSHSGAFADAPINTDDSAFIEYSAPRTQRAVRAGEARFLIGMEREHLYNTLAGSPGDPYLNELTDRQQEFIEAGRQLSRALLLADMDQHGEAHEARSGHDSRVPPTLWGQTSLTRFLISN